MSEPVQEREKLLRRIEKGEARIAQTRKEKGRLKWLALAGAVLSPIGFIWGWLYALWILSGGLIFWAVGLYLNWGHVKDGSRLLEQARLDLERFDKNNP